MQDTTHVLIKFNGSLLVANQEYNKTRIEFNTRVRGMHDFLYNSRVVSSVEQINLQILDLSGRSLMYRRNNEGPRTNP